MNKDNTINILICLDDLDWNYARHCAVTMLSILETNKNNKIKFFILSSCLPEDSIKELKRIAHEYNQEIEFIIRDNIVPDDIKSLLIYHNKNLTRWTRYRLFFNLYIKDINRILYLDCDTIVAKDLSEFYNMDMEWKTIVGYYDPPVFRYKKKNLNTNSYINAWVLLIDVEKYNNHPITIGAINEVNKAYWQYLNLADQDYLNILFSDEILIYKRCINYLAIRPDPLPNKWIDEAIIIHCVIKPYLKYSLCPRKVIKLYYSYLNKTKRKDYPKEDNSRNILTYFFELLCHFVYLSIECIFWIKRVVWFGNLKISERLRNLFHKK